MSVLRSCLIKLCPNNKKLAPLGNIKIDEPDTPFEHGDGLEAASDGEGEGDVPFQQVVAVADTCDDEPTVPTLAPSSGPPASGGLDFAALEGKLAVAKSQADLGTLKVGVEGSAVAKKKAFKVCT